MMKMTLSTMGEPTDWTYQGSDEGPEVTIYHYSIRLDGQARAFDFGLTSDGKVASSQLK
jgi:hypothetical protein